MNAIHWTLIFILNTHGNVSAIVTDPSVTRDFARCAAEARQTGRVLTEQTGVRTSGTCLTLTGSQMALAEAQMAKTYDCRRDGNSLFCSGTKGLK